jgi:hypothetical protein
MLNGGLLVNASVFVSVADRLGELAGTSSLATHVFVIYQLAKVALLCSPPLSVAVAFPSMSQPCLVFEKSWLHRLVFALSCYIVVSSQFALVVSQPLAIEFTLNVTLVPCPRTCMIVVVLCCGCLIH